MKMIRLTYIVFALLAGGFVSAQETEPPTGAIEDAQIIIEKDKPLTLPRASRVYKPSAITVVAPDTVRLTYDLSQPQATFDPYTFSPEVKTVTGANQLTPNFNFVKVGFGNYLSPEIRGFAGVVEDDRQLGLYVSHESFARGPVRKDESAYSNTQVRLQGDLVSNSLTVSPFVNYQLERYYFYGFDEAAAPDAITERIATNYFGLGAALTGKVGEVAYKATPLLSFTGMAPAGGEAFNQESSFGLDASGSYHQSDAMSFQVGTDYRYYGYQSGITQKRHLFHLTPEVRYATDRFMLSGGVSFGVSSDSVDASTAVGLFPVFKGSFALNEQFALMARADGGFAANSLDHLRNRNRYLQDSLVLSNRREKVDLEISLEYKMRHDMSLEPFIGYTRIAGQAFFVPSTDSARYTVRYDAGDLGQSSFGVRYRLINNRSQLTAEMAMISYQTDTLAAAWYLPATTLKLNYIQSVGERWKINGEMFVWDGLKGAIAGTASIYELPTIVDLSLGAAYAFDERFSAYAHVENVLGIQYERYLNYPVRGITAKIGFIYRF